MRVVRRMMAAHRRNQLAWTVRGNAGPVGHMLRKVGALTWKSKRISRDGRSVTGAEADTVEYACL